MQYFVNAQEMKDCDTKTIREFGMPSAVLMERAALAFTEEILALGRPIRKAGIVCGMGKNGGDGIAVARLLKQQHIPVQIYLIGDERKAAAETAVQLTIARNYQIPIRQIEEWLFEQNSTAEEESGRREQARPDKSNCDITGEQQLTEEFSGCSVLIDAVFGVGLSREVTGIYAKTIQCMNKCSSYVCSIDIPSGIDAGTGQVLGCAVYARLTVTFAFCKAGLVLYPGAEYAGTVITKEIGITEDSFGSYRPSLYTYTLKEILSMLPVRKNDSHKGTFGKVVLIAGSRGMAGAAYLSAMAAYRMGCGLVRIITPQENRQILQSLVPEALLTTYDPQRMEEELDRLMEAVNWGTIIGIGPGMGTCDAARMIVERLLPNAHAPLVIDADGLNLLSQQIQLLGRHSQPVAVTPHLGEMSRLTGRPLEQIRQNLVQTAVDFSKQYQVCCVLKDAHTIVSGTNSQAYINLTGNHGMSAGGSGDILTGMICGLAAQGIAIETASVMGVHLHGYAGDLAAAAVGKRGMMARDLLQHIPDVFA